MIISAVIFDLDGTILEDEDEYGKAFNKVLKSLGVDSNSNYPQVRGIGVKENWIRFIEKYGIKTNKTPDILAKETEDAYMQLISSVNVRVGFDDFAEKLKESGVKVALATSSTWEQTERILDLVNLQEGVFDEITTIDEVIFSKPDPDLFTITADKLGVERGECLVIEDASSGVEAARRAGMKVVAISGGENPGDLSKADLVVEGFSEITAQAIDQL